MLKGEKPLPGRAGDSIPDVDLEAKRVEAEAAVGRKVGDTDLASYLMYPKVFKDYAAHRSHYGDVSQLPTPSFFYGLAEREEIAVEIDRGKTLIVSRQGTAGPDQDGHVRATFELNGQSRTLKIAKAGMAAAKEKPRAEEGNPKHVGAPMPGSVVTIAVKAGQKVAKGDPLLSIEAMKMETMLTAERDAVVAAIHTRPGEAVNAKDLLLEFA